MDKRFITGLLTLFLITLSSILEAQVSNPYIINGNAYQENCNCYTLTNDLNFQSGSVWNKYKIDLTQSFDYTFNVFLGCRDADGADGIAFVLQPIGTSIGTYGGGLGYMGISPSVGILIDTWQNIEFHDPPYDHMVIFKNGNIDCANLPDVLDGPVPALPNYGNIEDCQWHLFHITWNASNHLLTAQIDNMQTVQATIDMISQVFGGNPQVYWGFTGATGGATNHQRFCTSLNPGFSLSANQNTCFPTPIYFQDSSRSFGTIIKWVWNFGDGTVDSVSQPAAHTYSSPGIYNVKLNIVGNNGCLSDTFKRQIVVGSKPIAYFGYPYPIACGTGPFTLTDSSYVQFGTINDWTWNINNGQTIISTQTGALTQNFSISTQNVSLTVSTAEGCVSDPISHSFPVYPVPATTMSTENACFGDPVSFQATNADPSVNISQWYWFPGDGTIDSGATIIHNYKDGGQFNVRLFALSDQGCPSDTLSSLVTIYRTHAFAGNDTIVAIGQPLQLHAQGGTIYEWEPASGLNNNQIADPIATLEQNATYVLTASTDVGCPSYDTINIKVYKGPEIYAPNAFTPNNDGRNDRFRCISVGMATINFFRIYNRYGQLMYSSKNTSEGWDGNFNGSPQPVGTYVWMVEGIDYKGVTHFEKGTVTLIR
ncbi:MAG: hypothetical protein C5B59_10460 [Bacteroidetes bacterium]|nr:MAG: hypothetical protein C5B59_10460 [Bacteroidota bacterium]